MTPVVLDTCVALWLAGQQGALSATARQVLADPNVTLHVSAMSFLLELLVYPAVYYLWRRKGLVQGAPTARPSAV